MYPTWNLHKTLSAITKNGKLNYYQQLHLDCGKSGGGFSRWGDCRDKLMSVVFGDEISDWSLLWRPDVGEVSYNFINFFATCRNASSIPEIDINSLHAG